MESKIKVDYTSRYGIGVGDQKEPVIRVEIKESEDPRDTLLAEIFKDGIFTDLNGIHVKGYHYQDPRYGSSTSLGVAPDLTKEFLIVGKSEKEKLSDIQEQVWKMIVATSNVIDPESPTQLGMSYSGSSGSFFSDEFPNIKSEEFSRNPEDYIHERDDNGKIIEPKYLETSNIYSSEPEHYQYHKRDINFIKEILRIWKNFERKIQEAKGLTITNPEAKSLPSRYQIGDECSFTTYSAIKKAFNKAKEENPGTPEGNLEYIPEYHYGKVVAVKFTEAKVWYDILDDYTGKVVEEVDSCYLKSFSDEVAEQVVKQK